MRRHLPLLLLLLTALPAMAHPGSFHSGDSFTATRDGFFHPLTGLDHLLVMVAVGLWAVRLGGRSLWMLPLAFVLPMITGGVFGLGHAPASAVEHGITASLLLLGTALGLAWKPSLPVAMSLVAASGFCHGFAHGSEMPIGALPLWFLAGMFLATALLHTGGVLGGCFLASKRLDFGFRLTGLGLMAFAVVSLILPS